MMSRRAVPIDLLAGVGRICLALPDACQEDAWTGVRWRVRQQTFAHLLTISDGWPPAYARAASVEGPAHVLMFRSAGPELEALRRAGSPFFPTAWRTDEIGLILGAETDWPEVEELLVESYLVRAPAKLARRVLQDRTGRPPA